MTIEKDVQKRILEAIYHNGGSADTNQIRELAGLSLDSVSGGTRHLISRALISKRRPKKVYPRKPNTYVLNQNLLPKIKRLISEIGQNVE